jgi:hypothetical protein
MNKLKCMVEILNSSEFQRKKVSFCAGIVKDIFAEGGGI